MSIMASEGIDELVRNVLGERKNANKVGDLISMLNVEGEADEMNKIMSGLTKFFTKEFRELLTIRKETISEDMHTYAEWLERQQYDLWDSLIQMFGHTSTEVREQTLLTCLQLMQNEIRCYSTPDNPHFPENSIQKLVHGFLINSMTDAEILHPLLRFADFRYFLLKLFPKCLRETLETKEEKRATLQNAFGLLKAISENMQNDLTGEEILTLAGNGVIGASPDEFGSPAKPHSKAMDTREQRQTFGNSWLEFLRHNMDNHLCKSVLVILQKLIIPSFSSPCLLSDFLTRSFRQGGGIALLSLHGIFILMTEHNLEYPQFYTHLYNMIHPRIFDAKYQSRFFFLLNVFLSSSHLPAYVVTAFAKKLARLTLVAPTYAQQLLVDFILTLTERHPSIKVLINRENTKQAKSCIDNDPYVASQTDPAQCKAMESSLWELTALRHHYLSSVATYVKEIDKGPKGDVLDRLEDTCEDIFISFCEKDLCDAPLNHKAPEGLFGGFEDAVMDLWSV